MPGYKGHRSLQELTVLQIWITSSLLTLISASVLAGLLILPGAVWPRIFWACMLTVFLLAVWIPAAGELRRRAVSHRAANDDRRYVRELDS